PRVNTPSAADGGHRPGGLEEAGVVDAVAGQLARHGALPAARQVIIGGSGPEQPAQVALLAGEQAVADLPVSGQPDPVAGAAERAGDGRYDADRGRAAVDQ